MNKKKYLQPMLQTMKVESQTQLLADSVKSVDGNSGMKYGGSDNGYSGGARADEGGDVWDDE